MPWWGKRPKEQKSRREEDVNGRMRGRRRRYLGGGMCIGLVVMVLVLMALLMMCGNSQYQHEYQSRINTRPSVPSTKPSFFKMQGYEKVFVGIGDHNFTRMHLEWDILHNAMHKKMANKGLRGPSQKDCFLWVTDCYNLAKHPAIVKSLIPILGPDIILYGMKLWKPGNETSKSLHLDMESGDCQEAANVAIGSKVRMLKGSEMYQDNLRHDLLRCIAAFETYQNHANIEDIVVGTVRKGMIRKPGKPMENIRFITIEPGANGAVIFHGKTVYKIEAILGGEESVILQFASAKCKIRDRIEAPNNVFLPPVLLISGTHNILSTPNDVRKALASTDALTFLPKTTNSLNEFARAEQNLSLFSWQNLSTNCITNYGYRTCSYGSASTAILSRVSFEYSYSDSMGTSFGAFGSDDEEKVVIVLNGSLLYYHAEREIQGYTEMRVLEIHGSTHIPANGWHTFVPASPYKNAFVCVRWMSRKIRTQEPFLRFKGYFGFRMVILQGGQAYDPCNENNCDVILVMLYGKSLQMLPSEVFVEDSETMLISGGDPCLLWNTGRASVAFVAIHVCGYDKQTDQLFNGDPNGSSYFTSGGRIMRKS